jgi:hypothetical protein
MHDSDEDISQEEFDYYWELAKIVMNAGLDVVDAIKADTPAGKDYVPLLRQMNDKLDKLCKNDRFNALGKIIKELCAMTGVSTYPWLADMMDKNVPLVCRQSIASCFCLAFLPKWDKSYFPPRAYYPEIPRINVKLSDLKRPSKKFKTDANESQAQQSAASSSTEKSSSEQHRQEPHEQHHRVEEETYASVKQDSYHRAEEEKSHTQSAAPKDSVPKPKQQPFASQPKIKPCPQLPKVASWETAETLSKYIQSVVESNPLMQMYYICNKDAKTQKKFGNAIREYAQLYPGEFPILCCDITFFGSADCGFVATTHGVHMKNNYKNDYRYLRFDQIKTIDYDDSSLSKGITFNGEYKLEMVSEERSATLIQVLKDFSKDYLGK